MEYFVFDLFNTFRELELAACLTCLVFVTILLFSSYVMVSLCCLKRNESVVILLFELNKHAPILIFQHIYGYYYGLLTNKTLNEVLKTIFSILHMPWGLDHVHLGTKYLISIFEFVNPRNILQSLKNVAT